MTCIILNPSKISCGENNYDSHKTTGISHIPWNMLLDPNYTSHNLIPKSNRTSFSPSQHNEYSPPASFSYQQNSFNIGKHQASPEVYYVPPQTSLKYPQSYDTKYSSEFFNNDQKVGGSFSSSTASHSPLNKIVFPAASSFQASNPLTNSLPHYVPPPGQQKRKKTQVSKENNTKKQKKR